MARRASAVSIEESSSRLRMVIVADTCVSEAGMRSIVGAHPGYHVCGSAHGFSDARELIDRHRPDLLVIEPFLEDRDAMVWIKELSSTYPQTRILIVSRQSERIYAERALSAGAAGYWMENGSTDELLRAIEAVANGQIYTSPAITALAVERFAQRQRLPVKLDALTNRQLSVLSLIAAGHRPGEIASELGIDRKTVETHAENIKRKLGCQNAEELKRTARELLGTGERSARRLG